MLEDPLRILIVEARFYDHIADELLAGAKAALKVVGAESTWSPCPARWRFRA